MQCSLCNRLPGTNEANLVIHHKSSHIMKRQVNKIMLSFGGVESKYNTRKQPWIKFFIVEKQDGLDPASRFCLFFIFSSSFSSFYKCHFVLTLLVFSKRSTQANTCKWEISCIVTELNPFTTKQTQQKRKGSDSFASSVLWKRICSKLTIFVDRTWTLLLIHSIQFDLITSGCDPCVIWVEFSKL